MEYTLLELGFDYLPYYDDETETAENEQSTETNTEIKNIDLPF